MDQWDDHTQDVEAKKTAWDRFATLHRGQCKLIRTVDHTYNRLELTIPRAGYNVVFEESDKQNWHVSASGPCSNVEPFSITPHGLLDSIAELLHFEEASFTSPALRKQFAISGKGSARAKALFESSDLGNYLAEYENTYFVLLQNGQSFVLKVVHDPKFSFESSAESSLRFLDSLIKDLFSSGVLI